MLFPIGLVGTLFAAFGALVLFEAEVALFVVLEVGGVGKSLVANVARVCLFGLVNFGMDLQAHKVVE